VKQLLAGTQSPGFQGCYVLHKANLCAPYALAVSYLEEKTHYQILAATNLKFSFRLMKSSEIHGLSVIFHLVLTCIACIILKYIFSVYNFCRDFIIQEYWIMSNTFSVPIEMRWACDFCPFLCLCAILHLFICIC
jgi:hypothetical protein